MNNEEKYILRKLDNTLLLSDIELAHFYEVDFSHLNDEIVEYDDRDSFFNLPAFIHDKNVDIFLFGLPYNKGTIIKDSRVVLFPDSLRKSSKRYSNYVSINQNKMSGIHDLYTNRRILQNSVMKDIGNIDENEHELFVDKLNKLLTTFLIERNAKFCAVGGDHSITFFIVKRVLELYNKKILIIQFDSHHDCGFGLLNQDTNVTHSNFVRHLLNEENIMGVLQIGLRGFRSIENRFKHDKLYQLSNSELSTSKLRETLNSIICDFNSDDVLTYITFDTDVIDPKEFPLVDFPIPLGIETNKIINLINELFKMPLKIIGMDIVEGQGSGENWQYDPVLSILLNLLEGLSNNKRGTLHDFVTKGV